MNRQSFESNQKCYLIDYYCIRAEVALPFKLFQLNESDIVAFVSTHVPNLGGYNVWAVFRHVQDGGRA